MVQVQESEQLLGGDEASRSTKLTSPAGALALGLLLVSCLGAAALLLAAPGSLAVAPESAVAVAESQGSCDNCNQDNHPLVEEAMHGLHFMDGSHHPMHFVRACVMPLAPLSDPDHSWRRCCLEPEFVEMYAGICCFNAEGEFLHEHPTWNQERRSEMDPRFMQSIHSHITTHYPEAYAEMCAPGLVPRCRAEIYYTDEVALTGTMTRVSRSRPRTCTSDWVPETEQCPGSRPGCWAWDGTGNIHPGMKKHKCCDNPDQSVPETPTPAPTEPPTPSPPTPAPTPADWHGEDGMELVNPIFDF